MPNLKFIFSFLLISYFNTSVLAQIEIPKKPSFQTSVYDAASLMTLNQKTALEQKLINYADTTSTQIVIATLPTLNGDNIDVLATDWAHAWGVGQSDKDNGVFILVAESEHKLVIKTGYGTQIYLTDAISKTIIEQIILPSFKKGNYYEGLDSGVNAIFQVMNGTFKNTGNKKNDTTTVLGIFLFIIVFVIVLLFVRKNKNKKGGGRGGRRSSSKFDIFDAIFISSIGSSFGGFGGGGSSGGFGGGGFSGGFGGGGFGGGGAGGSW